MVSAIAAAVSGAVLLLIASWILRQAISVAHWEEVQGTVIDHHPIDVSAGARGSRFQVELLVDYDFRGASLRSTLGPLPAHSVFASREAAMGAAQAQHPRGKQLVVRVDPGDPSRIDIEGRETVRGMVIAVVGGTFLFWGLMKMWKGADS